MADLIRQNQANEEVETPVDTSNPEEVNKARKKYARTRADRLEFVKAAMDLKEGRAWLYDLIVRCHVFRNPFVTGDEQATAFKCGEQNIGLMILDDIQTAAADKYIDMIRENK